MKAFVLTLTIILAIKAIYLIIKFGGNNYPLTQTLKAEDAAFLLALRLMMFLWGFVLLVRLP